MILPHNADAFQVVSSIATELPPSSGFWKEGKWVRVRATGVMAYVFANELSHGRLHCAFIDDNSPRVLSTCFSNFPGRVKVLKLTGGFMDTSALLAIEHSLDGVETLDVSVNGLDSEAAKVLGRILSLTLSIKRLLVSDNKLGSSGVRSLVYKLPGSRLTELNLENNQIGSHGAKYLRRTLERRNSLTELNLGRNYLGDKGACELAKCLRASKLIKIDLSHNRIGSGGVKSLVKAVVHSCVSSLSLSGNMISAGLFRVVSRLIGSNGVIRVLDLSYISIGTLSVKCISNVLSKDSILESLYMRGVGLDDKGCEILSRALNINTSLTTLSLCHNHIENKGIAYLADALRSNNTLHFLDIGWNWFTIEVFRQVGASLTINRSLHHLMVRFTESDGSYSSINNVFTSLERNMCLFDYSEHQASMLQGAADWLHHPLLDPNLLSIVWKMTGKNCPLCETVKW